MKLDCLNKYYTTFVYIFNCRIWFSIFLVVFILSIFYLITRRYFLFHMKTPFF